MAIFDRAATLRGPGRWSRLAWVVASALTLTLGLPALADEPAAAVKTDADAKANAKAARRAKKKAAGLAAVAAAPADVDAGSSSKDVAKARETLDALRELQRSVSKEASPGEGRARRPSRSGRGRRSRRRP